MVRRYQTEANLSPTKQRHDFPASAGLELDKYIYIYRERERERKRATLIALARQEAPTA